MTFNATSSVVRLMLPVLALTLAQTRPAVRADAVRDSRPAAAHGVSSSLARIDRRPTPFRWSTLNRRQPSRIPLYDPNSDDPFQVDLRGYDLSLLDLCQSGKSLRYASFDDKTIWPSRDHLPPGFDLARIMDAGRNPGLAVRQLHEKGITGKGVSIAIIDQPLLVDHQEYAERLRLYEEISVEPWESAAMHGPAVASIAVGRTVGVAPQADLYYIAAPAGRPESYVGEDTHTWYAYARAIFRLLQINQQLPADRKIRVISISAAWRPGHQGYREITEAASQAKTQGMLVISASVCETHGFHFAGLGRHPLADPDDFGSYGPASWAWDHTANYQDSRSLLVPMDARATAGPTGRTEYAFYGQGGLSWAIPYIAGAYALAVQVEPRITPDRFWTLAMQTGRKVPIYHRGARMTIGPILDPARLVEALTVDKTAAQSVARKEAARRISHAPVVIGDINEKVAKLDINTASREDVIRTFGQPKACLHEDRVLDAGKLPDTYLMAYSDAFVVWMQRGRVSELRFTGQTGYVFRDTIRIGASVEEAVKVLGQPRRIVLGAKTADEDGVLYLDLNAVAGDCCYNRLDQGVRLTFRKRKVTSIVLTPVRSEHIQEGSRQ